MKNIKHAKINTSLRSFFKMWLNITSSFHNMTAREISVMSSFLYHRHILSKEITNERILWKILFDYDTKMKIKSETGLNDNNLQTLLTSLRKKKVIVDNKISKVYIPEMTKDCKNFKIIYDLRIEDEG